MKGDAFSSGLRLSIRVAVVLWLGVALAWLGGRASPDEVEMVSVTALQESLQALLEQAPIEQEQPVAPKPEETPRQSPQSQRSTPVSDRVAPARHAEAAEIASGQRILDGDDAFPALSASYDDFRSFADYTSAMSSLGARFVVIQHREIVARIDPNGAVLSEPGGLAGFSPRARNYSDEPGLRAMKRAVESRYGPGAAIRMLVPREIDAALFGAIERVLLDEGRSPAELREVRGRYRPAHGGGVEFHVEAAVKRDGRSEPLSLRLDLSQTGGHG